LVVGGEGVRRERKRRGSVGVEEKGRRERGKEEGMMEVK